VTSHESKGCLVKEEAFLSRSWNALKAGDDWWVTIAILSLVYLVPVVGPLVVLGYSFRWAREAAWGVEDPLPTNANGLGAAFKSGWIVFFSLVVWTLVCTALYSLLVIVPVVGVALGVAGVVLAVAFSLVVGVMALRGVIYDRMGPAFQVSQAWNMCRNEPKGLAHVFLIKALFVAFELVVIATCSFLLAMTANGYATGLFGPYSHVMRRSSFAYLFGSPLLVAEMVLVLYALMFVHVLGDVLVARSFGYWTAQFQPATWGGARAGVPAGVGPQRVAERRQRKAQQGMPQQGPQVQQPFAQQVSGQAVPGQTPYRQPVATDMRQPYYGTQQPAVQSSDAQPYAGFPAAGQPGSAAQPSVTSPATVQQPPLSQEPSREQLRQDASVASVSQASSQVEEGERFERTQGFVPSSSDGEDGSNE